VHLSLSSFFILLLTTACFLTTAEPAAAADDFTDFLKPLMAENCVKCHGKEKTKGKVNLFEIKSAKQFMENPTIIRDMIGAIDAYDMPPDDEPELKDSERLKALATLKTMLREATAHGDGEVADIRVRRLNRFQYNNSLRDLFQLKKDVFLLPEKTMTRHGNYYARPTGKMPPKVSVSSLPKNAKGGFAEVRPYPKDLRALHGFDNQSNQLTMSPLLLDTFLKLSVSIVESPDFNERNVGVWSDFFRPPAEGADTEAEVRKRLEPFLTKAFRSEVDKATLDRYIAFTMAKHKAASPAPKPAPKDEPPPEADASTDLIIADFEGSDYAGWKVEGRAFGTRPAIANVTPKNGVTGFLGKGLVNSFLPNDGTKGKLTSPTFTIERKQLNFLIGAGNHKGKTCMNLLIDGKAVRTAVGDARKDGGREVLKWATWDVAEFKGKKASLEIVDDHSAGWGHINVDHIYMSDTKPSATAVAGHKSSAPAKTEPVGPPAFTVAMKKVTSAVLSSPLFLYRYRTGAKTDHYELASRLSFMLWGSGPDDELLKLAASGDLAKAEVLDAQIDRMLKSPKIERFADTFPTQWMQLENLMAATPDPKKFRFYNFEPNSPANKQMVLETRSLLRTAQ
jgi:hypothetical protein